MDTTVTNAPLTPETLRPFLEGCGYHSLLLRRNYRFGTTVGVKDVPLAGFAHQPADVRSVCIAVIEATDDPQETVISYRALGAPLVFVCHEGQLQWWRQDTATPQRLATLEPSELPGFFQAHHQDFDPARVYRAKTRGRFAREDQLAFVDVSLMPLVEGEIGQALSRLVERVMDDLIAMLQPTEMTATFGQRLFRDVFWLLAAKILRDKEVPSFRALDFSDIDDVFARVARHYGSSLRFQSAKRQEREAFTVASRTIAQFSHLGHMTTESLAYVYENALISKDIRSQLGVHSTPSYLVDYMIWRLAPWIEEIPATDRHAFEPACGHAAFLVSTMRLLKELHPISAAALRTYLRQRLHGIEIDPFAIEIARLAMTLADSPNPDDWDIQRDDLFASRALEQLARRSTILLANPPFENFTSADRRRYAQQGFPLTYVNKAAELLHRTLPHLRPGAVCGVVVPQGFLHSKNATNLRAFLARHFEIAEVCLFPDKVFAFSDMESAILLGRRIRASRIARWHVRYRRVREPQMQRFRESYVATTDLVIPQRRFVDSPTTNMHIPELEEVWKWCQGLPRFDTIADIGKGLEYKSKRSLPGEAHTISSDYFPGAVRGFARLNRTLRIDGQPPEVWMSLAPSVISRPRSGTTVDVPQVLLNYAPIRRSHWRLKAVIDKQGHAVTSRFLTIRPHTETTPSATASAEGSPAALPLEFLWALCNAPLAHAYVYTHSEKRNVLVGVMRAMPVPHASSDAIQRVVEAVRTYFDAVASPANDTLSATLDKDKARQTLQRVDAEILHLYDLPPRLERQVLDLFAGQQRPGVPFTFDRYFPEDFLPCFSLHMYLSESYQRSTAGALRARYKPITEPAILDALERALQEFKE